MLSRAQKEAQVAELKEKFSRATCLYLVDYRGLGVEAVNKLRRRVRKEGNGNYEYRVLKNAVLRRAAEGSDYARVAEQFVGPTAIALSFGDPAGLAKILGQFAGENQAFALKGGVVDGSPVTRGDISVLATHFEGFGLVLVEAMAQGTPVIGTAVGGVIEIIADQETGLLHRHADDTDLASKILTLLSNDGLARRLAAAGQRFVEETFSMDRFAAGMAALYGGMLSVAHTSHP